MNKMGLEEYKGVFIYAQQVDNELSSIAFELIGKAKELAKEHLGSITVKVGNVTATMTCNDKGKIILKKKVALEDTLEA